MTGKDPLLTRSKIREMKDKEGVLGKIREHEEQRKRDREYQGKDKEISKFFNKERKKSKPLQGSRADETGKIQERSSFLVKAIVVVTLLLIVVFLAVFFL